MRTKELSLLTTEKMTKVRICWSLERFLPVWKSEHFPHLWNMIHHCSTEGFRLFLPASSFHSWTTLNWERKSHIRKNKPISCTKHPQAVSGLAQQVLLSFWGLMQLVACSKLLCAKWGLRDPGGSGVLHIVAALVSSIGIRGKMGTEVRRSGKMGRRVGGEGTLHS